MAEMHQFYGQELQIENLVIQKVKVINISTYRHRTSDIADLEIIFTPNTDLALWNYIAREIVYNRPEAIDWDFVKEHIVFAASLINIGYGMRRSDEKSIKEGKYLKLKWKL